MRLTKQYLIDIERITDIEFEVWRLEVGVYQHQKNFASLEEAKKYIRDRQGDGFVIVEKQAFRKVRTS